MMINHEGERNKRRRNGMQKTLKEQAINELLTTEMGITNQNPRSA